MTNPMVMVSTPNSNIDNRNLEKKSPFISFVNCCIMISQGTKEGFQGYPRLRKPKNLDPMVNSFLVRFRKFSKLSQFRIVEIAVKSFEKNFEYYITGGVNINFAGSLTDSVTVFLSSQYCETLRTVWLLD